MAWWFCDTPLFFASWDALKRHGGSVIRLYSSHPETLWRGMVVLWYVFIFHILRCSEEAWWFCDMSLFFTSCDALKRHGSSVIRLYSSHPETLWRDMVVLWYVFILHILRCSEEAWWFCDTSLFFTSCDALKRHGGSVIRLYSSHPATLWRGMVVLWYVFILHILRCSEEAWWFCDTSLFFASCDALKRHGGSVIRLYSSHPETLWRDMVVLWYAFILHILRRSEEAWWFCDTSLFFASCDALKRHGGSVIRLYSSHPETLWRDMVVLWYVFILRILRCSEEAWWFCDTSLFFTSWGDLKRHGGSVIRLYSSHPEMLWRGMVVLWYVFILHILRCSEETWWFCDTSLFFASWGDLKRHGGSVIRLYSSDILRRSEEAWWFCVTSLFFASCDALKRHGGSVIRLYSSHPEMLWRGMVVLCYVFILRILWCSEEAWWFCDTSSFFASWDVLKRHGGSVIRLYSSHPEMLWRDMVVLWYVFILHILRCSEEAWWFCDTSLFFTSWDALKRHGGSVICLYSSHPEMLWRDMVVLWYVFILRILRCSEEAWWFCDTSLFFASWDALKRHCGSVIRLYSSHPEMLWRSIVVLWYVYPEMLWRGMVVLWYVFILHILRRSEEARWFWDTSLFFTSWDALKRHGGSVIRLYSSHPEMLWRSMVVLWYVYPEMLWRGMVVLWYVFILHILRRSEEARWFWDTSLFFTSLDVLKRHGGSVIRLYSSHPAMLWRGMVVLWYVFILRILRCSEEAWWFCDTSLFFASCDALKRHGGSVIRLYSSHPEMLWRSMVVLWYVFILHILRRSEETWWFCDTSLFFASWDALKRHGGSVIRLYSSHPETLWRDMVVLWYTFILRIVRCSEETLVAGIINKSFIRDKH